MIHTVPVITSTILLASYYPGFTTVQPMSFFWENTKMPLSGPL